MDIQFIIIIIVGIGAAYFAFRTFIRQFTQTDESIKCNNCPVVDDNKQ